MAFQSNQLSKKLSEEDLINKIREQVHKNKFLSEGTGGYHIRRGMAHSVSGYCEDIFALYVAQYLNNKKLNFYVDKVISTKFEGKKRSTSFKPDLAIVDENNVLTHYFDIKTNLGWNRHLENYLYNKEEFIASLRLHGKAWITSKPSWLEKENEKGETISFNNKYPLPNLQHLTVSENLKYHIVVVFGSNINADKMEENYQIVKLLKNVELNVLSHKERIVQDSFDSIHRSLDLL